MLKLLNFSSPRDKSPELSVRSFISWIYALREHFSTDVFIECVDAEKDFKFQVGLLVANWAQI